MAINYELLNKGGISLSTNFELLSNKPLDARQVIPTLEGLQNLIENGAAYEGLVAYVESQKTHYKVQSTEEGTLTYREYNFTEDELKALIASETTGSFDAAGQAIETEVLERQAAIAAEKTAREAADSALSQSLTETFTVGLSAETQRAQEKEDLLSAAITIEKAEREAAISSLYQNSEIDTKIEEINKAIAVTESTLASAVETEAGRAAGVEADFEGRITEMEVFFKEKKVEGALNTLYEIQNYVDTHDGAVETIVGNINTNAGAIEALQNEFNNDTGRVKIAEGKIAVIEGEGAGSIKKAEADAKAYADGLISAEVTRSDAKAKELADAAQAAAEATAAGALATVKGDLEAKDAEIEGNVTSVSNRVAALEGTEGVVATGDAATLEAAKGYTDSREALIRSELKTAYEGYADGVAATAKSEAITSANGYTDGKVTELSVKDGELVGLISANTTAIGNEESARIEAVNGINANIETIDGTIETIEDDIEELQAKDEELAGLIGGVDGRVSTLETASTRHAEKTYVDTELAKKVDKTTLNNYYTSAEVDSKIKNTFTYEAETMTLIIG